MSEFAEEQDLREIFERFGRVTRVFLAKDRETGRAKGFAFISFADRSDAQKACEKIDGCEFPLYFDGRLFLALVNVLMLCYRWVWPPHSPRRVCKACNLGHLSIDVIS